MNITEEKLLEYLSKALVCVAVIVIGYIITRLIIGILRKILNKSRMDGRSCITGFAEKCCQRTCNFDKQTVCVG